MDALTINPETVGTADIAALLNVHFALMRSQSPEVSCHVMTPDALATPQVTVMAARQSGVLLGVGALKIIEKFHGELKSMHTAHAARGKGVGAAMLNALLDQAQSLGLKRVSLETGTDPVFKAARTLYHAHGFEICPPFGDYLTDPLSVFMTRTI